jgi:3-(3-hydroxy-phenyl)propionate hydroxylase
MKVTIAGAGPVGAILALGLAQRAHEVVLIESELTIDESPRAATVHPSTLEMLADLGLMDDILAGGLVARYFDHWDRPSGSLIARFDHDVLRNDTRFPFVVQIEQHKLVAMALARLAALPNATVLIGTKVIGFVEAGGGVDVQVSSIGSDRSIRTDYLVGADGGRSTVRKVLGVEFEGYTWPERFLVLTTGFDFQQVWDCSYRNYFTDPTEWLNLFKIAGIAGEGRWRAVFPTTAEESDDDALSDRSVTRRLSGLKADGAAFEALLHRKLYRVHQRVAASFRVGRVLIAGDAAHVNNPIGGLGLNSGIHDAAELVDVLDELAGGASDDVLDRYEARRRMLNVEFVQEQTVANKKRLEETDTEARKQRAAELAAIAADPEREREFLLRTSLLASVQKAKRID